MANLEEIKTHLSDELQPSRRERGKYICPLCGSGDHGNGSTAAFSIERDGLHGKCFSCNFYGDIFDLVAARDGISPAEATRALIAKYQPGAAAQGVGSNSYRVKEQPAAVPQVPAEARDFTGEIARAQAALKGSKGEQYLIGRGLTAETIERFQLGYVPAHYFPGAHAQHPAVMIPYDAEGHYAAWRAIGPHFEGCFDKPKTAEAGEEPVFYAETLYYGGPVFVVESQLDAITIEQEGGRAVAIGGGGLRKLEKQIEKRPPAGVLILCFDNDEPGRKDYEKAAGVLTAKQVPFIKGNISGDEKDPNDLLMKNPEALRKNIISALDAVEDQRKQEEEQRRENRQNESIAGYIDGFMDALRDSKSAPAIPTGFSVLDSILDGGLYPGLYIIGAITSLGKTTFTLQICDQIAAAGHDVLFFSLEMARHELMAKSISRLTFDIARRRGSPRKQAKTTRGILASKRWDNYSREELALMAAAIDEYKEKVSSRIWIYEGVGNIGVEYVRAEAEKHIAITGRLPVVVIDYLQILAPVDMRASDKQNTDKNVLELKRLSRDKGIPVFGISSLNRDNYMNPINNAAFKESGAIEYSSDVLIGLQFSGMDYEEGESEKNREKRIRELIKEQKAKGNAGGAELMQLKILKNRNGKSGTDATFNYYPMFNDYDEIAEGFIPVEDEEITFPREKKKKPL